MARGRLVRPSCGFVEVNLPDFSRVLGESGQREWRLSQRPAGRRGRSARHSADLSTCASLARTAGSTVTGGSVCSSAVDLNHQTVLISFHFVILMQIHYFLAIKKPFCLMISNCFFLNIWLGQSVRVILVCVLWPCAV